MECYKVLRVTENGNRYSILTSGYLKQQYFTDKVNHAKKDILEKFNYGMFVFNKSWDAVNFANEHWDLAVKMLKKNQITVEVWRGEAPELFEPVVKTYRLFPVHTYKLKNKKIALDILDNLSNFSDRNFTNIVNKYFSGHYFYLSTMFPGFYCKELSLVEKIREFQYGR